MFSKRFHVLFQSTKGILLVTNDMISIVTAL